MAESSDCQANMSVQNITRHCRGKTWRRKKSVNKSDSGKKKIKRKFKDE